MKRVMVCLFTVSGLLSGCGETEPQKRHAPDGTELLDSLDLPPAAPGELQIVSPIVRAIPPGKDITLCSYLDYRADKDFDVISYAGS